MAGRASIARLLLALVLAWGAGGTAADTPTDARRGVLDLGAHGNPDAIHELRGEWAFDWANFAAPPLTGRLPAFAPIGSWNELTADGKPPGADGFATYGLDVHCSPGQQLAVAMATQRTAMRLYVNGKLAAAQGMPGRTPAEARPAVGQRTLLTEPFACPLRLTIHLSNYSHRSGGLMRAPVAGPLEVLTADYKRRLALDTILLGAYLVLVFTALTFYLARRRDRSPLVFGLFALAQTVYADMTGERLLLQMVQPETDWETYLRIEYLAWYASMGLFVLTVQQMFPRTLHKPVVRLLVGACGAGLLLVALTPARVYSEYVAAGQALGVTLGMYVVYSALQALRRGRRDAGILLAGMACLGVVLLVNVLDYYTGITLRTVTAIGLLAFVFSPAAVLTRRLARALTAEEMRSTEQREKADLIVRTTQAGILDWDAMRGTTHYSPRLLEILGYPRDTDTSDWPLFVERIHPHERALVVERYRAQLNSRAVRNGEKRHEAHEYRLVRRDGSTVWVHAEAISLRGGDGRVLRYICSVLDITDHRAVAEGLKRQNAALAENARLREDVERMSRHDLKTPLNSIIGVTRLLREDPTVPAEQRELLAITERAGYRLLEMINLSLDLSRMELGTYDFRPQAVNLVDVVGRVMLDLQGLADGAKVQVKTERAFSAPVYARAEELLCYSILANLLKNAIEATPPGGTVKIGLEPGDPVRVWVRNPQRVAAAVIDRFFDKYVTAGKSGGTGLGTYSARLMARVQHGELVMETGDAGTLLLLTLRALGAEQLPPPKAPAFSPGGAAALAPAVVAADFPPRRVLLADDDDYHRLLLLRYLPSPPFTVDTAENGLAATEAATRHWPDIVLIDMEMPVMNGLEAVAWIRDREAREGRPPCLVLMLSSNDDPGSIRRGLAAGCNRYLTKPFTREALLAVMHELDTHGHTVPMQVPLQLEEPQRGPHEPPAAPDAPVHVDAELLGEVPAFLDSRRRMVDGMRTALAAGEREQLRAVAHRAAGGLALFGFQWAAWQSRRIAAQAAQAPASELEREIERLRGHLQEVRVLQAPG